jgi:geranylgeranyl pyrophosphate synthase
MVTGCDNILDNEYKKTLETDLPEKGTRFRSVLDIMVSDRVMFDILLYAMESGAMSLDSVLNASALSLHALLRSGAQEAGEESGITGILPPEEVLQQVHHYKTGLLFQAPWHIPRALEAIPKINVDSMMEALYEIGMGCQIMDDMVDLSNDIRKHHHNYVLSLLYHDAGEEAKRQVNNILSSDNALGKGENVMAAFPETKAAATKKALLFLKNGLETLFEPTYHFLVQPAISFLSKRIGGGLILLE